MPKYLIEASYRAKGVKGVLEEGGTARREAIARLFTASGGTLESFYFAFGDVDVYVIGHLPSNEAAAGVALSVGRSGAVDVKTVVLLTPEQIDAATHLAPQYTPPGS